MLKAPVPSLATIVLAVLLLVASDNMEALAVPLKDESPLIRCAPNVKVCEIPVLPTNPTDPVKPVFPALPVKPVLPTLPVNPVP
jgi:hypothetical protein